VHSWDQYRVTSFEHVDRNNDDKFNTYNKKILDRGQKQKEFFCKRKLYKYVKTVE